MMKVIYNKNYNGQLKSDKNLIISSYYVDGFSVYGLNGDAIIEASNDNFLNIVYSKNVSNDGVFSITPISALKWRIRYLTATTGNLYIGNIINIKSPSYPYAFEQFVYSSDRKTEGGQKYSVIKYKKNVGVFSWSGVQDGEIALWRNWYNDTDGFRRPYIIEVNAGEVYLVSSPSKFPLIKKQKRDWSGQMTIEECL